MKTTLLTLLGISAIHTAKAQCTAEFSFLNKGNGLIEFYDSSIAAKSHFWVFGDGDTSFQTSPSHTYLSPDTYFVKLAIDDSLSCKDTISQTIIIPSECKANFSFNIDGTDPYKVHYTNTSTVFGAMSYRWKFGNGYTSTATSTSHEYGPTGLYSAVLVVEAKDHTCSDSLVRTVTINGDCNADFTFVDQNNTFKKDFINLSTGQKLQSTWYFGDDSTSQLSNPSHTYDYEGFFKTSLYIVDSSGRCRDSVEKDHWITGICKADFTAQEVFSNQMQFVSKSSHHVFVEQSGNLVWLFDDGSSDSNNTDSLYHTYDKSDFYWVSLILTTSSNCKDTMRRMITPGLRDTCKAQFEWSFIPYEPQKVQFKSLTQGYHPEVDWDFADGLPGSTEDNPLHEFHNPGDFNVRLAISDTLGLCTDSIVKTVNIPPKNCKASFDVFKNPEQLRVSCLNTSQSTNATFIWDLGDGTSSSTDTILGHPYPDTGSYTIKLILLEKDSICADTVIQTVHFPAPTCTADFSFSVAQSEVNFQSLSKGYKLNYFWDFGDTSGTSNDSSASYPYQQAATYAVTLKITDGLGYCTDSVTRLVTTSSPKPCKALFTARADNRYPNKFYFTNLSTGATEYRWDFGDGDTSNSIDPVKTYSSPDSVMRVVLLAKNSSGCKSTHQQDISLKKCNAYYKFGRIFNEDYIVLVIDQSVGNQLEYKWDFGDGTTSVEDEPEHDYDEYGRYSLCLTVESKTEACTDFFCDTFGLDSTGDFTLKKAFKLIVLKDTFPTANLSELDTDIEAHIYPNPFYSQLTVAAADHDVLKVTGFFSATGKSLDVPVEYESESTAHIDTQTLQPGIYIIQLQINDKLTTRRIIKQ